MRHKSEQDQWFKYRCHCPSCNTQINLQHQRPEEQNTVQFSCHCGEQFKGRSEHIYPDGYLWMQPIACYQYTCNSCGSGPCTAQPGRLKEPIKFCPLDGRRVEWVRK